MGCGAYAAWNRTDQPFPAPSESVVELDYEAFEDLVTDRWTIFGLLYPGRLRVTRGSFDDVTAWEAALTNTLSPGDLILMAETGHFAALWKSMATKLGLAVEFIPGDWRRGVDPLKVEARLNADPDRLIKAVCIVHNETATGVTSDIAGVRAAIDRTGHPALYMVDTISSLASIDYRHDEWRVDVTVAGSQKGLMLPPGLSFNAISEKALAASRGAKLPRSYWDWAPMITSNQTGYFPYTPATNLLYGLAEALDQLFEEGLENVFARHKRHGEATRRAVRSQISPNQSAYLASPVAVICGKSRAMQKSASWRSSAMSPRIAGNSK